MGRRNEQLEVHSVERIYLRQMLSDGWVNKNHFKTTARFSGAVPIRIGGILPT